MVCLEGQDRLGLELEGQIQARFGLGGWMEVSGVVRMLWEWVEDSVMEECVYRSLLQVQ